MISPKPDLIRVWADGCRSTTDFFDAPGQFDDHGSPLLMDAFEADLPAQGPGRVFDDREPEPCSPSCRRSVAGFIDLIEPFEDADLLGQRDPDALVAHADPDAHFAIESIGRRVLGVINQLNALGVDRYGGALVGELDRVLDQVPQDEHDQRLIGRDL